MIRDVTIYDPTTGKIIVNTGIEEGQEDAKCLKRGWAWLLGEVNGAEFRIDTVTGVPVPLYTFDLVVEPNRISNIPEGTTAYYLEFKDLIDDGDLEIECEFYQVVRVMFTKDLYTPAVVELICEA